MGMGGHTDDQRAKRRQQRRLARARAQGVLSGVLSMLRPGDVVFDCGANVGEVTLPLAATGATVHAFEPDPVAFEALRARVEGFPNVRLHCAAVGLSKGRAMLRRAADFASDPEGRTVRSSILAGGRDMDEGEDGMVDVEMADLPALLRETIDQTGEVAFLKLDIEGTELDILEAMDRDSLFDKVRLTVAETHEGKFPGMRARYKALRARLADYPTTRVNLEWT